MHIIHPEVVTSSAQWFPDPADYAAER